MDEDGDGGSDSVVVGTPATGGSVKIYFNYNKESQEAIFRKADFCSDLATKLRIKHNRTQ